MAILFYILEFGVHLAQLTVDRSGPLAIRQLASVLLKQYVEAHWSQQSDKFRMPETPPAVSFDSMSGLKAHSSLKCS